MFVIEKKTHIHLPLALVYEVAADIKKYPEFIIGIKTVKTEDIGENECHVIMDGSIGPLKGKYRYHAVFTPPIKINVAQVQDGSGLKTEIIWSFIEETENTTVVDFFMKMEHEEGMSFFWKSGIEVATFAIFESFIHRVKHVARERGIHHRTKGGK